MKAQIISFHCILKTKLGQVISKTVNHDVLTLPESGPNQRLKGLTEGLQDLKEGEKRRIDVPAQRAYGYYDPAKVMKCSRDKFHGSHVELGDQVAGKLSGGGEATFRVISLSADEVELDANHPLAGQDLVFEIEALDVREATANEVVEARIETEVSSPLH